MAKGLRAFMCWNYASTATGKRPAANYASHNKAGVPCACWECSYDLQHADKQIQHRCCIMAAAVAALDAHTQATMKILTDEDLYRRTACMLAGVLQLC